MVRADRRSNCPVACTLDIVGDRWTLLVIRDLLLGKQRFDEFLKSPEGIATNILTDRLRKLEELRLIDKVPGATARARATYRLTAAGMELRPVIAAMVKWGQAHVEGTGRPQAFEHPEPWMQVLLGQDTGRPKDE